MSAPIGSTRVRMIEKDLVHILNTKGPISLEDYVRHEVMPLLNEVAIMLVTVETIGAELQELEEEAGR